MYLYIFTCCVCGICVFVFARVCAHMYMHVHVWVPEIAIRCLPFSPSTFCFEPGSLHWTRSSLLPATPVSEWDGPVLSPPPGHHTSCYAGSGDLNTGSHASGWDCPQLLPAPGAPGKWPQSLHILGSSAGLEPKNQLFQTVGSGQAVQNNIHSTRRLKRRRGSGGGLSAVRKVEKCYTIKSIL